MLGGIDLVAAVDNVSGVGAAVYTYIPTIYVPLHHFANGVLMCTLSGSGCTLTLLCVSI